MVTYLIVGKLDPWNHDDSTVASVPIVVSDQTTLTGRAFAFSDTRHAESDVRSSVEGSWVEHSDTVPAGLYLDGKMALESI